ncbi:hypothetical protein [uncultured Sphingomonas sp.]|uniref:hypothetical protein n=1 Tax=uncultured Sphingomonas sp. TaxID=158754 RepID=UPI00344D2F85
MLPQQRHSSGVSATTDRAAAPVTPDGRYLVVRGRLWRRSNPALSDERRAELVAALMDARRIIGSAGRAGDRDAVAAARARVHAAKVALGERGPVWWNDGAPDLNRRMARNTPYAAWFAALNLPNSPP